MKVLTKFYLLFFYFGNFYTNYWTRLCSLQIPKKLNSTWIEVRFESIISKSHKIFYGIKIGFSNKILIFSILFGFSLFSNFLGIS